MATYNKSILEYDDVRSAVLYAREEAEEKALRKGLRKGRLEGRLAGEAKGLRKGRLESLEKQRAIVVNCLKRGMAAIDISDITGLTEREILKIKASC